MHFKRGAAWAVKIMEARPTLRSWLIPVWEAYQKLSTCRYPGFSGTSRIPWTAIDAYARRRDIDGWRFDRLEHLIEVLDGVYLASTSKPSTMSRTKPGK